MSTGQSAQEEVTELLKLNTDHREWCGQFVDLAVSRGTLTAEQGRDAWASVFGETPAAQISLSDEDAPRGGAVAWAVLVVLFVAGCVALWLLSEWLAPGGWLR